MHNGDAIGYQDMHGRTVRDDHFLLILHSGAEPVDFRLPPAERAPEWTLHLATDARLEACTTEPLRPDSVLRVPPRTFVVLRHEVVR